MMTALNLAALGLPGGCDLRSLDGLIAVAFDGYWTRTPRGGGPLEYCRRDGEKIRFGSLATMVPTYTTSIDEAVGVLKRAYPGIWWLIGEGKMTSDEPDFGCQLQFGTRTVAQAEHHSAPLAIIAAMILALPDGTMNEARQIVASYFAENPEAAS